MKAVFRQSVTKQIVWTAVILLVLSACASVVKIERIPTPSPLPTSAPDSPPAASVSFAGAPPRRIVAEKVNLDAPVVEMGWRVQGEGEEAVSIWNVPENEAGWHINSAQPGQGSNVVISGHNNSTGGHVFGQLDELEVGDQISVWVDEETVYTYTVSETQIIRAFGASPETLDYLRTVIQPTTTEQLTLITCWPSWTNTHRFILIAHPT